MGTAFLMNAISDNLLGHVEGETAAGRCYESRKTVWLPPIMGLLKKLNDKVWFLKSRPQHEEQRPGDKDYPHHVDSSFAVAYQRFRTETVVPWQGLYTAYQAARYVVERNIKGTIVECGVFKGGCSAIMVEAVARYGPPDREFYLYDTFAGMVKPTHVDRKGERIRGDAIDRKGLRRNPEAMYHARQRGDHVDWCYGSIQEVRETLARTGYPQDRLHFIKGKVEDTIPDNMPEQVAVLRLDTDFYESTRHELIYLYPRLVIGGVLIVDDYEAWEGARKAVDEYFEAHGNRPLFFRDAAYGAVAGIKI